jgi:hypothetical protein
MTTWTITLDSTDYTPEALGVEVIGGVFRSGSASSVRLRCNMPADATQIASYNDEVLIKRNGSAFFRGRIRAVPKQASDTDESQDYLVEDAWADLERTTYQELWAINGGTALLPRVFLGVDAAGDRITLGEQIEEALDFAIAAGVSLTKGSIPAGMMLWPSEENGLSCAEIIRLSLRYHPDYIPWIDHTTSPPTFHVTPRADAAAMSLAITNLGSFDVVELEDRLPSCVRVVYETLNDFDGEVERVVAVDKFPTDGPDSGPGVLTTTVELQGVRSVVQKQQVEVRTFPSSQETAKAYIKLKYPAIKDVPDTAFNITAFDREIIPEPDTDDAPPINPLAERIKGEDFDDLPRELVRGSIHEWMRRKVGKVRLEWEIAPTGTATAEQIELLARVPKGVTVTGTNATKKIYKSLASWTDSEAIPTGIAQAYYETITAGCRFEGSVSLLTDDLATPWHGKKLNLTGGLTAWSTMAAPIHGVTWDAQTDEATISFGPTPDYSFQDFLEYLRLLNQRPANWISTAERTSAEIGSELGASANGDVIGSLITPTDDPEFTGSEGGEPPSWELTVAADGEVWKYQVASKGSTVQDGTNGPAINLGAIFAVPTTISATSWIMLEADVDADSALTNWAFVALDSLADVKEVRLTTSAPIRQDKIRRYIGKITFNDGLPTATQATTTPLIVTHAFLNAKLCKVLTEHNLAPA